MEGCARRMACLFRVEARTACGIAVYSYSGDGDDDYYPPGDAFAPPSATIYDDDDYQPDAFDYLEGIAAAAREDAY